MKKQLLAVAILFASFSVKAQMSAKDSLLFIKNNKEILNIKTKIAKLQDKLKSETSDLNDLKDDLPNLQDAAKKAADNSQKMAGKVDVGDETAARKSSKAAKKAESANSAINKNRKAQKKSEDKIFDYNYAIQELNTKLQTLEKQNESLLHT